MNKTALYIFIFAVAAAFVSCGGAKLSVADEQMARGEYFDAAKTYRKVYNKLDREQRSKRGEIAFKMAECHRMLRQNAKASAAYMGIILFRSFCRIKL